MRITQTVLVISIGFLVGVSSSSILAQETLKGAAPKAAKETAQEVIEPGKRVTPGPMDEEMKLGEPVPVIHSVSIGGYSPVSYFTENAAVLGKVEYAVAHEGEVYYLTSAQQVEMFIANPKKYQPRFQTCPYGVVNGKKLALDPTNFKVIGDTLLLFHRSEAVDGLAEWNESGLSDDALLKRADTQHELLRF